MADSVIQSADAVLFDMDGVLVDSEEYWERYATRRIIPTAIGTDESVSEPLAGMNVHDIYAVLDRNYGTVVSESEFVELYDEVAEEIYTDEVSLLPGCRPLLDHLRNRVSIVGLVSSAPERWIRLMLERFGLTGKFDIVVSAENAPGEGKPEPDVYEYTLDRIDCPPDDCLVVEDSTHGVEAAVRAGTTCIRYVPSDTSASSDLDPFTTVNTPAKLRSVLDF